MSGSWPLGVAGCALGALLLVVPPAGAQGVHFGVAGGLTFDEINVSGDEHLNVVLTDKAEAVGGICVAFGVTGSFSIQPEALLSIKGSRLTIDGRQEDIRLSYIETPVLFRYRPPDDSPARWLHFLAGPYVAFLVNASLQGPEAGRSRDIDDAFKTFDIGWVVGLGVGGTHARLDLRYSGGVSDIAATTGLGGIVPFTPADVTYRNRGFRLIAAYLF